jgi:hypothetical protein
MFQVTMGLIHFDNYASEPKPVEDAGDLGEPLHLAGIAAVHPPI